MQIFCFHCNRCRFSRLLLPTKISTTDHDAGKRENTIHHQRNAQSSFCFLCNPLVSATSMTALTNPKPSNVQAAQGITLPVVGKQFCSSSLIVLTVRKKPLVFSGGGFTVTDSNGDVIFRVDGRGPSLSHRLILMDGAGKPLLTIQRKVLTMYNRWDGYCGERHNGQKPIFSVRRSLIFPKRNHTEVFMSSNRQKKHFDYKIEGCYSERSCTVYNRHRSVVAEVKRKCATSEVMLSKDVYIVMVRSGLDQAFIMGLIVILHQMSREHDSI